MVNLKWLETAQRTSPLWLKSWKMEWYLLSAIMHKTICRSSIMIDVIRLFLAPDYQKSRSKTWDSSQKISSILRLNSSRWMEPPSMRHHQWKELPHLEPRMRIDWFQYWVMRPSSWQTLAQNVGTVFALLTNIAMVSVRAQASSWTLPMRVVNVLRRE